MSSMSLIKMSEAELMEAIRALVKDMGLHAFHVQDSRRSWGAGFPDLVVAGLGGCLFREVKTQNGTLTNEQRRWGHVLQASGMRWAVWRPADLAGGRIVSDLMSLIQMQFQFPQ